MIWIMIFEVVVIGALFLALWHISKLPECFGEYKGDSPKCWGCEDSVECEDGKE